LIVGRADDDADAGRGEYIAAIDDESRPELLADALHGAHDVTRIGDIGDQDRELVAPKTGDGILRPQTQPEALGDLDKKLVSHQMAEAVVDDFEPVEVEHDFEPVEVEQQDGEPLFGMAFGALTGRGQPFHEPDTVREAGEDVVQRKKAKLSFAFDPARDIAEGEHKPKRRLVIGIPDRGDAVLERDPRAAAHGEIAKPEVSLRLSLQCVFNQLR